SFTTIFLSRALLKRITSPPFSPHPHFTSLLKLSSERDATSLQSLFPSRQTNPCRQDISRTPARLHSCTRKLKTSYLDFDLMGKEKTFRW
ncbi:hypothetical protein INR49_003405, partial [Caranx melampygus]